MHKKYIKTFKALTYTWSLSLYIACIIPAEKIPLNKGYDKIEHFAAYFILTCLIFCGWPRTSSLKILAFVLLFGAFIELTQFFIPSRTAELLDILANIFGMSLGLLIMNLFKKKYSE